MIADYGMIVSKIGLEVPSMVWLNVQKFIPRMPWARAYLSFSVMERGVS